MQSIPKPWMESQHPMKIIHPLSSAIQNIPMQHLVHDYIGYHFCSHQERTIHIVLSFLT